MDSLPTTCTIIRANKQEQKSCTIIRNNSKNKLILPDYYYFGELGFFMIGVLPCLDRIIRFFSVKINLYTMPDLAKLLNLLYPQDIAILDTQYVEMREFILSSTHDTKYHAKHISELLNQYYPYVELSNQTNSDIFKINLMNSLKFFVIDDNTHTENNTVLIFPRNRTVDKQRNMSLEVFDQITKLIHENIENPHIIVVGHKDETLHIENIETQYDFMEIIKLFATTKLFITSDSGLKDLALNSSCKNIIMITTRDTDQNMCIDKYHYYYNPFSTRLLIIESKKINEDILKIITFIENAFSPIISNKTCKLEYLPKIKLYINSKNKIIKQFVNLMDKHERITITKNLEDEDITFAIIDYQKYIFDNLRSRNIKKISIFGGNYKDLISDSNYFIELFDKVSNNHILTHHNHKEYLSIVIQGHDNPIMDLNRQIYFMYACVVQSTWREHDINEINRIIRFNKYDNTDNVFYQVYTSLAGIKRANTSYVIKTRSDEYYTQFDSLIDLIISYPDKITTSDVYFRSENNFKYHISDHLIGGSNTNMLGLFLTLFDEICNKIDFSSKYSQFINKKFGRLTVEQKLTLSFLTYKGEKPENQRNLMEKYFMICPTYKLGQYGVAANKISKTPIENIYDEKYAENPFVEIM